MNQKRIQSSFEMVAQIHDISVEEVIAEIEGYLQEARTAAYQKQNQKSVMLWDRIPQTGETVKAETVLSYIVNQIESLK